MSSCFLVPNPSAVRRLSTALACVDPSGRRNAGPGRACTSTTSAADHHTWGSLRLTLVRERILKNNALCTFFLLFSKALRFGGIADKESARYTQ